MSRTAAADSAAFFTFMDNYKTSPCVGFNAYGAHGAAALVCPVAGIDVNVKRPQAFWTMVAGCVAKRFHFKAAVLTDKSFVVFAKSFFFQNAQTS